MANAYAGAPFERLVVALAAYERVQAEWPRTAIAAVATNTLGHSGGAGGGVLPLSLPAPVVAFASRANCARLFECAAHGWLRVRATAARVLALMPSPLPGWEVKTKAVLVG